MLAKTAHIMLPARQLMFPFPSTPDYSAAALLPTEGTTSARQALQQYTAAAAATPVMCLYGSEGSGKTHLMQVWCAQAGAFFASAQVPQPPYPVAVAVDDIDTLPPSGQTQLFHLFNHLQQTQGRLVVSSRQPVKQLPLLPDLKSRLLSGPSIEVLSPTAEELAQLALKWAAEHQLVLPVDVITYLLSRAERSAPALRALIQRLDTLSLEQKRAVTIPLARQALNHPA